PPPSSVVCSPWAGTRAARAKTTCGFLRISEIRLRARYERRGTGTLCTFVQSQPPEEDRVKRLPLLAALLAGAAVALVAARTAPADVGQASKAATGSVVFVQTNEPSGNHVVVYDRG